MNEYKKKRLTIEEVNYSTVKIKVDKIYVLNKHSFMIFISF